MAKPVDEDDKTEAGRVAPSRPLAIDPVAAMTATTAISLDMMNQFTTMMLGVMQDAVARTKAITDAAAGLPAKTAEPAKAKWTVVERPALKTPASRFAPPIPRPPAPNLADDDLKAISGIGPKLEQMLNGMGCRQYADIAAWTAADVAKIDAELGLDGRIARDGWVEQAKALVAARG